MDEIIYNDFYNKIKDILNNARSRTYKSINFEMVTAYWNIGKSIVEEEQKGNKKAEYGQFIVKDLSVKLTKDFGKGFNETNIRYFRLFYLNFPNHHALRDELTWTHYRLLLKVEKSEIRDFYIKECIENNWSTRQLERQINSFYYERILSSKNKDIVKNEISELEPPITSKDIIKDPYILEFLDLKANANFFEKELEQSLIDKLQDFLLELGKGFSFVARQKRISFENEHFYIDLVFYNYILKSFVLIDLKIGKLTHQDIGQMDTYVRLFEDKYKIEGDNPTIGIILCSEKNDAMVKYSILENSNQVFASKYLLYLPTEEELKNELKRERNLIETEKKLKL